MQRILIISLFIVSLLLVFTLQNQDSTNHFRFLLWDVSGSFFVVLALLVGLILGIAVTLPAVIKKNKKIDELNSFIGNFREKERQRVEEDENNNIKKEE